MLQNLKKHTDKLWVVFGGLSLFLIWYFGYENYLYLNKTESGLDWKVNRMLSEHTALWFSMFGYKTKVITYLIYPHLIYLNNEPILSVDTPCNGLPMLYLYGSFILIYPGNWRRKLVFLAGGLSFIHLLNMIRLIALAYISLYSPDYFYFNHKYLFQIIVYFSIISIWLFFILYGSDGKIKLTDGIKEFFSLKVVNRFLQII